MLRLLKYLMVIVLLAGLAGAWLGSGIWTRLHAPYKGYAESELFVDIPSGSATADISRRLVDAGVVEDGQIFRAALWWSGGSRSLKAGEYRFDRPVSPLEVVGILVRGEVYARRITFPEGLTTAEMAKIFESRGFGPARQFSDAARRVALIAELDPAARDLEGYLFPETYALPRGTPASRLVEMMVERFKTTYSPAMREQAAAQGFSTRELVTLASLIEKETAKADERPMVAAVYRNRLKIRMGMQADPTVVYALMKAGRYDGNIRREDLAFDSPYNTYKYPGLPPGPIAAPGQASLAAALAPAAVPYLYFVSRNDGSHVFSRTLAEHNANVRQYQVEYFREQRRRGR